MTGTAALMFQATLICGMVLLRDGIERRDICDERRDMSD